MRTLNSVTLVSIATGDHCAGVRRSLERCQEHFSFAGVVVLTDKPDEFPGCQIIGIEKIVDKADISYHQIYTMSRNTHLFADHTLLVHDDSWIVNPRAWTDEFLDYDYIGAVWVQEDGVMGNDGFSLRSKRLLETLRDMAIINYHPSDCAVCRTEFEGKRRYRSDLEAKGIRYAPVKLARQFSVENEPYVDSFGFHGDTTHESLVQQGRISKPSL